MNQGRLWSLLLAGAVGSVVAGASLSDEPTSSFVILELYTSQGCSSCPPADEFLKELANAEPGKLPFMSGRSAELIPLGLHVDYWDYLGWKDQMADPTFTQRQRDYARSRRKSMIYTPQMIVQGQVFAVGSNRAAIKAAIGALGGTKPFDLIASDVVSGDGTSSLDISMDPAGGVFAKGRELDVFYFRYHANPKEVDVMAGENRNRKISYANVVTDLRYLGSWEPSGTFSGTISSWSGRDDRERELIVLQQKGFGVIVGANFLN